SNINYNAKKREIVESFTDFGNVLSLTLPTHPSGRNKGYCFLTIENTEDTSKVISKLNQFKFMGRTLRAQKQR
ncbi:MAG: RNA-binding protein, partial [Chloroflexota bacterium]